MTATIPTTDRPTRKPFGLTGTAPATDVESYDSIPWYRKQEFALFPLFVPLLIAVALTGSIYTRPTAAMRRHSGAAVWRYTLPSRLFFVAVDLIVLVAVYGLVLG